MLEWISSTTFPAQQSDLIAQRQEGIGLWFLNSPEYTQWMQADNTSSTLLCTGIPGAGKTMIAATAIDHLLETVQCNDIGVAYIYCNYKKQSEQTATALLAGILKQLVQGRPSAAEPAERIFNRHSTRGT